MRRGAHVLGIAITDDGANEIAKRARGTPRVAGRLLRRVRDFAEVGAAKGGITRAIADRALRRSMSMPSASIRWTGAIYAIATSFGGGPVGIETLAAALSEPRDAIEESSSPI